MLRLRAKSNLDYFLGLLVAFPFAYPNPPFYISSFIFLALVLPRVISEPVRIDLPSFILLFLYSTSLVLSSLFSSSDLYNVTYTSLIGNFIFLIFFVFSHYVVDVMGFFRGFVHGNLAMCATLIALFFILDVGGFGVRVFYVPEYRMWADGLIPDWPNYIVFIFCCAALMLVYFKKTWSLPLLIILLAAVMTTSRLVAFGVFFVILLFLCIKPSRSIFILLGILVITIYVYSNFQLKMDSQLIERMVKSDDREGLFTNLATLWLDRPFLGYGAISLGSLADFNYASFHNSYLEALVKGGGIGLSFFLLFILRSFFVIAESGISNREKTMLTIILIFFLVASLFQNYLKHPHVIILYSMIFYRYSGLYRSRHLGTN